MPGVSQRQRLREAQLAGRRAARLRRVLLVGGVVLAVVALGFVIALLLPH